jgi:hypothetical protein
LFTCSLVGHRGTSLNTEKVDPALFNGQTISEVVMVRGAAVTMEEVKMKMV